MGYNTINAVKLLKKYHMREQEKYSTRGQNDENNCQHSLLDWFSEQDFLFLTCYYWHQLQSGKNMDLCVSGTNQNFVSSYRTKTISMKLDSSGGMSS